jgi:8-oxo-dGTP pyrophosphatase MutT (NUDIX family)
MSMGSDFVTSSFDIESLSPRLQRESYVAESERQNEPVAAVAIIVDPNREGGSILLIRREERQGDPWSGQIAFPGGHRSPSDQTLLQTAVRETMEEVGIHLSEHTLLGALPALYSRTRRVLVAPFVFQLNNDAKVQLNQEVAESFWAPLNELSNIPTTASHVQVGQGELQEDSYVYDGRVIWGLTFRIINVLLDRSKLNESNGIRRRSKGR